MTIKLKENERLDDLHRQGYQIIQDMDGFCFGMDAVLLSGFAKVRAGEKVLDLGTGTGIIPILLEGKTEGEHFTGLEIQPSMADMARRSVLFNKQEEKVSIVAGDIKEASRLFGGASFDVVTTNPPYMTKNHGLTNPDEKKAIARHEILCSLADVIREASKVLKPKGRFYMVHRPSRLVEILSLLAEYSLQPKTIRFVHPYKDKESNMVLIEAFKGGRNLVSIEPPLIIYEKPGQYMKEIYDIYGY